MIKVTLDTNCIIDLEEKRDSFEYLRKLVDLNNKKIISVGIPTISASEKQKGNSYANNYTSFEEKLENVGLQKCEPLKSMLVWGIGYWGKAIWVDKEDDLYNKIQSILFPSIQYVDKAKNYKKYKKWVNQEIDIIMMWTHIYYKRDIFITRDTNFLKEKKEKLLELGANKILQSKEAYECIIKNDRRLK